MRIFIILLMLVLMGCNSKIVNDRPIKIDVKSTYTSPEDIKKLLPTFQKNDNDLYLLLTKDNIGKEYSDLIRTCNESDIDVTLWPLLNDEDGPWANEDNVDVFSKNITVVMDWLTIENIKVKWIVVNMENSKSQMDVINNLLKNKKYSEIVDILLSNINKDKFNEATHKYQDLVKTMHDRGYKVMVTTYPYIISDFKDGDADIQDICNTPIADIPWDAHTLTTYRTAYSGDFNVKFTSDFVYSYAKTAKEYDKNVRLALGIAGKSSHGQGYTGPEDLALDIAAAKAAKIDEVDVFYLDGMVDNLPVWLETKNTKASIPQSDSKVMAMKLFIVAVDKLCDSGNVNKETLLKLIEMTIQNKENKYE